ncbi:MAG: hypothetical protein M3P98_01495 [bacterium]|nr:hypothetical protein [bacterium]
MKNNNKVFKDRAIENLNELIWKTKYDSAFITSRIPMLESQRDEEQAKADKIEAELTEKKTGDQKKKAVREELKALTLTLGKARQRVGYFNQIIGQKADEVKELESKLTGLEGKLEFLTAYEN